MKIGFSPESIVGLDGMPLVGRVTLFAHDSDTAINVYTLEGDTFVQAENPQLLNNAGRLDNTLFFESAIVDVLVEKYVGAEGMMSVDSPDSDFETFDSFEIGFDTSAITAAERVDTIAELTDADTDKRFVEVMGYYAVGDCVPRTYYWDADSVNDIDGGYVVGSNVEDSGRWILLWNDEILPSSVYGVIPQNNETNFNALLSYPQTVGSFLQKTSPCVRFERGEYSLGVAIVTTKKLVFDRGAKFTNSFFKCPRIDVLGQEGYIADFEFTDPSFEAHSSWFRSVSAFWSCGAKKLVIDSTNYFINNAIASGVDISGAIIEGKTRIAATYSEGAFISFSNCTFVGGQIFSVVDDFLKFSNTAFTDKVFQNALYTLWDFGEIADGHHLQITNGTTTMDVDDFRSVDVYVKARLYAGDSTLDLRGRRMDGDIVSSQLSKISNAEVNGLKIDGAPNNAIVLEDVTARGRVKVEDSVVVEAHGCKLIFSPYSGLIETLYRVGAELRLYGCNSSLDGFALEIPTTKLGVYGGSWAGSIAMPQASQEAGTLASGGALIFENAEVIGSKITTNYLSMTRCKCSMPIDLVTWKNSGGVWNLSVELVGNTFTGKFLLDMKPSKEGDATIENVILSDFVIIDNVFNNSGKGVRCRYWVDVTTLDKKFLQGIYDGSSQVYSYTYENNVGNCPSSCIKSEFLDFSSSNLMFVEDGWNYYRTKPAHDNSRVFCVPSFYRSGTSPIVNRAKFCTLLPYMRHVGLSSAHMCMPDDEKIHFGIVPVIANALDPTVVDNDIFDVYAICDDQYGVGNPDSKKFFAVRTK